MRWRLLPPRAGVGCLSAQPVPALAQRLNAGAVPPRLAPRGAIPFGRSDGPSWHADVSHVECTALSLGRAWQRVSAGPGHARSFQAGSSTCAAARRRPFLQRRLSSVRGVSVAPPDLGVHDVHVYWMPIPKDPSPSLLDGAARCLPPDELSECGSRGDARASRLLSRALTRCVLTSCLRSSHEVWRDVSPDRVPLLRTRDGKPYLAPLVGGAGADAPHLAFNATNTGALIGVALTRRRDIGLDVEHLRRRLRHGALSLARRRFSRAEAARLAGLSPDAQQEEVMKLWTLKEAYVKAVGCGISASPGLDSFAFDLGAGGGSQPQPGHDGTPVLPSPPGIALAFEAGHGDRRPWQFWLVQPQSALVAAVCVRGDEVGTPTRLRTFTLDAQDLLTPDAACGVDAAVLAAGAYLPVQVQADRA